MLLCIQSNNKVKKQSEKVSKNIYILCAKLGQRDEWFLTSSGSHRSLFDLKNKGGKRKKIEMFHMNRYYREMPSIIPKNRTAAKLKNKSCVYVYETVEQRAKDCSISHTWKD